MLAMVRVALCQTPAWPSDPQTSSAPAPPPEVLSIRVVSGNGGTNFLKRKFAVIPVVEVRDGHNRLVAGATVIFTSPEVGPGLRFVPGRLSSTAVTEMNGQAKADVATPVRLGAFEIMVTANYSDNQMATAVIHQTNYKTPAAARKSGVSVRMKSSALNRKRN